jgi:hypothetical protein
MDDRTIEALASGEPDEPMCKHCGGPIAIRNPSGSCDHIYFPDMLTDEAKRANGYRVVMRPVLEKVEPQS